MAPETIAAPPRSLCFAIGPYGEDDSATRKWSNFVHDKVLAPAMPAEYRVKRTIDEPRSGRIWQRIEQDLEQAPLVIADLSDANPNAYFELGFRHARRKPVVHIARAGTVLPFDVRDFPVIFVAADWVESRGGFFASTDEDLQRARNEVREFIEMLPPPASEGARTKVDTTPAPVSAKVYRWQAFYAPNIHTEWLKAQPDVFRDEVDRYENGGGTMAISESRLVLFAEYLALKGAAGLTGEGTIFLTMFNQTQQLDFGYAAFRFGALPDPLVIEVVDVGWNPTGLEWISFQQRSRPVSVDRGGRQVPVTIPGYNYTLDLAGTSGRPGFWPGTMKHPTSGTSLGRVELRAKYGDYLR